MDIEITSEQIVFAKQYNLSNGYCVDIIYRPEETVYEFYLRKYGYGKTDYMFGIPRDIKEEPDVKKLILTNAPAYIDRYENDLINYNY